VVLWLHGFYVRDAQYLFHSDATHIREQVLRSGKDVVVIAPFLGHNCINEQKKVVGNYSVEALAGGQWGERYLNEVLVALTAFQKQAQQQLQQQIQAPGLTIKNLVIACHSGGGRGMRFLAGTLGKYQTSLRECWGFDCLYGGDDATFWYTRALGKNACSLYIFYGPSTLTQSVHLDLLGRGKATLQGDQANPPGPYISTLHVTIGHYEAFPMGGQMVKVNNIGAVVDDLMTRPAPQPQGKSSQPIGKAVARPIGKAVGKLGAKPQPGAFVKQAVANLKANFIFVDDIHYVIPRAFLSARLRDATFL
jgi:hypothetical protein